MNPIILKWYYGLCCMWLQIQKECGVDHWLSTEVANGFVFCALNKNNNIKIYTEL